MTTRTYLDAARDELVAAAIAWEAGDARDERRLADAVFAFRRARGDFAPSAPRSRLDAWVHRLAAGENADEAARAVGGTGRPGR